MRATVFLALVVVAACYAPAIQPGSPCNTDSQCPAGLRCIDLVCGGHVGGPDGNSSNDGDPDGMITATDSDGDGVANSIDNCPTIANGAQGNEDGDSFGDACDPCPIDTSTADADSDGVGDACDPRPNTSGDSIAVFEGFHAGVPTGWQLVGNPVQAGDDLAFPAVLGNRSGLAVPMNAPATGTLSMKVTVDQVLGNNTYDGGVAVLMPYDIGQENGIFCELYQADNSAPASRDISIYDTIAGTVRGRKQWQWQLNVAYTLAMTRNQSNYTCAATAGGINTQTVNGSTNNQPMIKQFGLSMYSTGVHVSWLMLVTN